MLRRYARERERDPLEGCVDESHIPECWDGKSVGRWCSLDPGLNTIRFLKKFTT